jgi:hypothetical protein
MELQHSLRVGEGALDLGDLRSRQIEHFCLDIRSFYLAVLDLGRVPPEDSRRSASCL